VAKPPLGGESRPRITQGDRDRDAAGEPIATVEHRHTFGSVAPFHRRELVDLVARLAAEELGEVALLFPQRVHDKDARPPCDAGRAILHVRCTRYRRL